MMLFWWYSEATKQYGRGRIIALGATVEDARVNAMTAFEPWAECEKPWLSVSPDQEDKDELAGLRTKFEADIAEDPDGEGVALAINGSE